MLSPLLLVVAIAVRLDSRGPAFFSQERTGRRGGTFRILKFRTMRAAAEGRAPLLTAAGDARITRIGRWLRKTKIDELPQLLNVIWGQMSLVGPRPEVPKYTRTYNERQVQVLAVRPGITGPAALACVDEEAILAKQKNAEHFYLTSLMPAKLYLDLTYCSNITFFGDVRLISQTLGRLLRRRRSENTEKNKFTANAELSG